MAPVLLIHSDSRFTRRISEEAGGQALIVRSIKEASVPVLDPSLSFSGIYLNPRDAGSSALSFIEMVLLRRPATPLFLFAPESKAPPGTCPPNLEGLHLSGVFSGNESFRELIRPLEAGPSPDLRPQEAPLPPAAVHPGYIPVPVTELGGLTRFPFDLFVEDDSGTLRLTALKNRRIEPEALVALACSTPRVHVNAADLGGIRANLAKARQEYMVMAGFPNGWKAAETLHSTSRILLEFRKGAPIDSLALEAGELLSQLFKLISKPGPEGLAVILELAKSCERSILCTTYALLLSRILRYERDSTIEVLGMASLLQDHSLRVSPFGNLVDARVSALSPEARAYFDQHPLRSADLIAKAAAVPEVTLQVIRQHHERPDRSGFPNSIGGARLHPMAEMLSLINLYLDPESGFHENREAILSRFSESLSRAFRTFLEIQEQP